VPVIPWNRLRRMAAAADGESPRPSSRRLEETLRDYDLKGERAIALAQGAIIFFILALHVVARLGAGLPIVSSWVVLALSLLIMSSALRWVLASSRELPERALDVLNVLDVALFLSLIWSYQYAYAHPAGGSLKAPSFVLLLVLIGLRALRFHPRPIIVAGFAAVVGWFLLVCTAIFQDGTEAIVRDYRAHLNSFKILIGAEVERGVALASLAVFLAIATYSARKLLSRAAHAADYADALEAARRNLEEATQAKEKAEAALIELDRKKADLVEQNRRFNAALGNMSQGLCMFDADQRLLVCNDRYIEMYGLSNELAKPGTSFRTIVESRIASGLYAGDDPARYLEERLSSSAEPVPTTKVQELRDGRIIAVMHEPMERGGWVATHEDITQLRRIEAQLAHMSRHDALTDLPNRVLLREQMQLCLDRAADENRSLVVLLIDIDRFKDVNETLGPSCGDTLLQSVAQRLSRRLKGVEMIASIGGDEFVVLKLADKPAIAASETAAKVQGILATSFDVDVNSVVVTVSIGIAIGPADGSDADQLIKNADLALRRAKSDGPGTARFFEREMDQRMRSRHKMERDLRSALHNGELMLYYQPQYNLARDQVTGFEALLRWNHPEDGLISPAEFIPLAEETGLIAPIGEWTLRQACSDAAEWPKGVKVAVNLSAAHFRFGNVRQAVIAALGTSRLMPHDLELEVTESVLLEERAEVGETLNRLHDIGVRIALDDFGTGYSTLSYLQKFPFDKIKIDRSFISELGSDQNISLAIIRSTVALANSLGVPTTAEGVETEDQLKRVRKEGCTEVQGFFIGRPRPVRDVASILSNWQGARAQDARRAG
jgi:diguanylate cyclase (GGDEF)-like protein